MKLCKVGDISGYNIWYNEGAIYIYIARIGWDWIIVCQMKIWEMILRLTLRRKTIQQDLEIHRGTSWSH